MRLYLFRHGRVSPDAPFAGHFDVPLDEVGAEQTARMTRAVRSLEIAALYASDLSRATEAVRQISKTTGLPFAKDARLRDLHLGWADGKMREEAYARDGALRTVGPESLAHRPFTAGGETIPQVRERVRLFVAEVTKRHRGRKVIVVGHDVPNRIIIGDALGLDITSLFNFRQDPGCLNIVEYGESRTRVALLNGDPAHASSMRLTGAHKQLAPEE